MFQSNLKKDGGELKSQKKSVDYANITDVESIFDPKVLFHGWLIYSYFQIFKLIKQKWLPGESADWFFDNITGNDHIARIDDTACPGRKTAFW